VMLDSLDIHLVPCTNPDGREYVMTVDDMWRKNRRVNQGSSCVGVDLNRNADFVWGVTEGQTSCQPCADTYVGSAAMSEPEARNVRHLLDTHRVDAFADVHSFSELVLYPWGHANTQTTDPTQRFTTLATGTCQPLPNPFYKEYMLPRDLQRFTTVAQRVVGAISDVRGRVYTPEPGRGLYATTGTNSDYAYSRHIADPAKHKTYGFTLETGPDVGDPRESFHPADPEPIKREAESGVLALIQQSICAIELIGTQALGGLDEVDALRRIRDDTLGRTRPGREWISLFERIQPAVVRAVATDDRFATHAADAIVRAARLSSDHAQRLDAATVTDLLALIQNLDEQAASPEIHAGVNAVRHLLHRMTDHTAADALKDMTRRGPRLG